jgi:hypothetical protein
MCNCELSLKNIPYLTTWPGVPNWSDGDYITTPNSSPSSHHMDANYGKQKKVLPVIQKERTRFISGDSRTVPRDRDSLCEIPNNLTLAKNSALRICRLFKTNELLNRLGEGWQDLGFGESHHVGGSCKPAGKKTSHEVCALGVSGPNLCHRPRVPGT